MKILLFLMPLLLCQVIYAQNRLDDCERIFIHAVVPLSESLPNESSKLLESKLSQIITNNGIADSEFGVRFVLTAKVNVVSKDIVVGPPMRISQKLEIVLMLGDIIEDKVYCQYTIPVIGVGQSEAKAFIAAIKNINPKNEAVSSFLNAGKAKIMDFYQTYCENIIAEALQQASQQNYEESLFLLTSIPDVCTDCLHEATQLAQNIYVQMIDARGADLLNQARSIWANNPSRLGAEEATRLLSQINFAAACQPQVEALLKEIYSKMNEIDHREWQHEMQVYHDKVEREKRMWNQHVREYNDRIQTQRMYMKAWRDVAITYAQNQPKIITRVVNYNRVLLW